MENIEFFNIEQMKTEPTAKLTWSKVDGVSYYLLTRKNLNEVDSSYEEIAKTKKEVYYDRKLDYNVNYSYKLRAVFDVDYFELEYEKNEIKSKDFKFYNKFNPGKKASQLDSEFPFCEMKLLKENLKEAKEYNNAKYLRIPKFYYCIDEENNKIYVSKTMINNNYDLFYSFIIDGEIVEELLIELSSSSQKNELAENEFKMDISVLNTIQFLYFVYFGVTSKNALIATTEGLNTVDNKPFNCDGENNYLFGLKDLFSEELFIDGIGYDQNKIFMSLNPFENNKDFIGYEDYDDFDIKNGFITEFDLDYFMPLKTKNSKEKNLMIEGKYLVLDKDIFSYKFTNDLNNKKIRIVKIIK